MLTDKKNFDVLKELFNIGVGGAATALNRIIKTKLWIKVPEVYVASINDVLDVIGSTERPVLSVYIRIQENFPSGVLLLFTEESAKKLVKLSMSHHSEREIDELIFISALKEIANIMTSYFLNNFSQFIKKTLTLGIPHFVYDMAGAILQSIISEHTSSPTEVLIVKTEIFSEKEMIQVLFLLIPEESSLKFLFEKTANER